MKKAPEAFRTISEVAEILETPAHVLRFWESKFYQIKPVKRAGGRRYYRPDDIALINGIRRLLQERGMTIRGVQRILQEEGVKHVIALGSPLPLAPQDDDSVIEGDVIDGVFDGAQLDDPEMAGGTESERDDELARASVAGSDEAEAVPPAPPRSEDAVRGDGEASLDARALAPDDSAPDTPPPDEAEATQAGEPGDEPPRIAAASDTDDAQPPAPLGTDAPQAPAEDQDHEDTMTDGDDLAPPMPPEPPAQIAARMADPSGAAAPSALTESPARSSAEADEALEHSERARIARTLRAMPRGQLGPRREAFQAIARRIDALLERMSEASGAGRW